MKLKTNTQYSFAQSSLEFTFHIKQICKVIAANACEVGFTVCASGYQEGVGIPTFNALTSSQTSNYNFNC